MTPATRQRVKTLVHETGFDLVRVAPAVSLHNEREHYLRWIEQGRAADMRWITADWARRASDPGEALPGARSVICVGVAYRAGERGTVAADHGLIARYAWGKDYHAVIGEMLERATDRLREEFGGSHCWFVDAGAAMDKALAARAGLGWYGKNTNILTEEFGSYVLLGEIVTSLHIEPDAPIKRDCGSCRLCVVACPTGALGPDYSIDSRRCISYLTIEHRGPIPVEFRHLMGAWVFGCDICQDVCPPSNAPYLPTGQDRSAWRESLRDIVRSGQVRARVPEAARSPARKTVLDTTAGRQSVDLFQLLRLTHDEYLHLFRGTSVRRAKVWMLRRNAAIALGNVGEENAVAALEGAMRTDEHEIVRGHAAWALGRLGSRTGLPVCDRLRDALDSESAESVRREIEAALLASPASITGR